MFLGIVAKMDWPLEARLALQRCKDESIDDALTDEADVKSTPVADEHELEMGVEVEEAKAVPRTCQGSFYNTQYYAVV